MKTLDDSIGLAQRMVEIGTLMNRDVIAMVTEMNLPLGFAIGNSLEVQEAIETLDGRGPEDLVELCIELGGRLLFIAGKAAGLEEGKARIREAIDSKAGLTKFRDMVSAQGGCLESLDNLAIAGNILELKADKQGWICDMDALSVGHAAMKLGAGRERKEDAIDLSVGIKLLKKVGDFVESGETYMSIFYNDDKRLSEVEAQLKAAVKWSDDVVPKPKLILAEITKDGVTTF
jgi:pyrimidine-nucleoside phosphorylase